MEGNTPPKKRTVYYPGDDVILDISGVRSKVLGEIKPYADETGLGKKYLIRLPDHSKKPVFYSEISPFVANSEKNTL